MQYLSSSVWLILLNVMPSRSNHVIANDRVPFFLRVIMNNTAMNMGFRNFFHIPRSRSFGSCGTSIFNFLRNLHIVFHSCCTNYISTSSAQGFPFYHVVSNTCYLLSFWWQPFIIVVLMCIYLIVLLSTFLCTYWPFGCLWKNVYSVPLPTVKPDFLKKFCLLS